MIFDNIKKISDRLSDLFSKSGDSRQIRRAKKRDLEKKGVPAEVIEHILFCEDNAKSAIQDFQECVGRMAKSGWQLRATLDMNQLNTALSAEIKLAPMSYQEYQEYQSLVALKDKREAEAKDNEKIATEAESETIEKISKPDSPVESKIITNPNAEQPLQQSGKTG